MRRSGELSSTSFHAPAAAGAPVTKRSDWGTLRRLFPYLWQYKWRVMTALAFMIGAKMANVSVPLLLKELVDSMGPKAQDNAVQAGSLNKPGYLRFDFNWQGALSEQQKFIHLRLLVRTKFLLHRHIELVVLLPLPPRSPLAHVVFGDDADLHVREIFELVTRQVSSQCCERTAKRMCV